jgi:hypothetical protein
MPAMQNGTVAPHLRAGPGPDSMRHDEIIHRLDQMTARLAALKA